MNNVYPRCRGCGYDLTGVGVGQKEAVCPECGEVFDPRSPFMRERWPPAGVVLVRLCWPGWVLTVLVAVVPHLGWFDSVEALIAAAFLWPGFSAYILARRYAHPAEFRLVMAGLFAAGFLGVLLATVVIIPIAAALA